MTVRDETIKELIVVDITQVIDRPTYASVELSMKELAMKAASIKTIYAPFRRETSMALQ